MGVIVKLNIFTQNFLNRLADANTTYRILRRAGYRVLTCRVAAGDSLEKPQIEVAGGSAGGFPRINDCIITRRLGVQP